MKNNIWDKFEFNKEEQQSALELLNSIKDGLSEKTGNELKLETEAVEAYLDTNPIKLAMLYKLFVVVPKLGSYRRKVLTVAEFNEIGRFPVSVVNHLDRDRKYDEISKADFLTFVGELLSGNPIKNTFENLYRQSIEYKSGT